MTPASAPNSPSNDAQGQLFLVPAPLDFGCTTQAQLTDVMPLHTLQVAASIQHWICENAKSARAYLNRIAQHYPLCAPLQAMDIQELPREVHKKGDHTGGFDAQPLLRAALDGHNVGLISEAGMPAIADPGSSVVRAAHDLGITVNPLVGPTSLVLALASSGLNGQNFAFVGYLPTASDEREQKIRALESIALKSGQTQIFIETPYRNAALLESLLRSLQHNTRLAIASGLSLESAQCHSGLTKQWKQSGWSIDAKTPTVFMIGR